MKGKTDALQVPFHYIQSQGSDLEPYSTSVKDKFLDKEVYIKQNKTKTTTTTFLQGLVS